MRALLSSLLILGGATASAAAPASIQGRWVTDDHTALVEIAPCGRAMCGTVAKMLDTRPNIPRTDVNNPDPHLRGRPIVGTMVLTGFTGAGASWSGGRAYDPKSGKSYRSTLALEPDGRLKVSGCILFICEARHWQRPR